MDAELNGRAVQGGDGGLDNDEGLPWQLTVHFSRLQYNLAIHNPYLDFATVINVDLMLLHY